MRPPLVHVAERAELFLQVRILPADATRGAWRGGLPAGEQCRQARALGLGAKAILALDGVAREIVELVAAEGGGMDQLPARHAHGGERRARAVPCDAVARLGERGLVVPGGEQVVAREIGVWRQAEERGQAREHVDALYLRRHAAGCYPGTVHDERHAQQLVVEVDRMLQLPVLLELLAAV